MGDNGGKNFKLDQAAFIDMGSLSRNSAFNVSDWVVRKGFNRLCGWLVDAWTKRWPMVSDLEMSDLL